MKIEFLNQYRKRHGLRLKDRLIAYLPRYAQHLSKHAWLANLPQRWPWLRRTMERVLGFSAARSLPRWRTDGFDTETNAAASGTRQPGASTR